MIAEERAKRIKNVEVRPVTTIDYRYEPGTVFERDGVRIEADHEICEIRYSDGHKRETNNHVRRIVPGMFWSFAEYLSRLEAGELSPGDHWVHDCPGWRGQVAEIDDPKWDPGMDGPRDPELTIPEAEPLPPNIRESTKAKVPPKSPGLHEGDGIIEQWVNDKPQSEDVADEARAVWTLFKSLTGHKSLKDCNRADAIALREHLKGSNKSKTVQRKIGHLCAAFNLAKDHYEWTGRNIFGSVMTNEMVRRAADSVKAIAYSEHEMARIYSDLGNWTPEERLLWVLCATTGMRAGEAFLIDTEIEIAGIRCFQIKLSQEGDTIKNAGSVRDLPIPRDAEPFLPKQIKGRLLHIKGEYTRKNLIRDVNLRIAKLGIKEPGKSLKSTRTRAASRLQNVEAPGHGYCPAKVARQITGHKVEVDIHDEHYAGLHPMQRLKPFVDHIGLGIPKPPLGPSA